MTPFDLDQLADDHLTQAREAPHGRSAHTIVGGRGHTLRHLVLALRGGESLADHEAPGEATLQVLRGRVTLGTATATCELAAGQLVEIPDERHNLQALEDAVVVLTTSVRQS
jgi:quercetin dioxygenase-like cupin family protein